MDQVLFVQNVGLLDCAMFEPRNGITGQSWHVDIKLKGQLDKKNNFIYDFGQLKKIVRKALKGTLDHSLLIPVSSPFISFQHTEQGEHWIFRMQEILSKSEFRWEYDVPKGAVYPINCIQIDDRVIENEITRLIRHRLPSSITDVTIQLRKESAEPTTAFFQYTHGIPGHEGLCQRLFHGHRSRIEIHIDNDRRPDLEHKVASEILGGRVHITTPAQIVNGTLEIGMRLQGDQPVRLAYNSSLGRYEGVLPTNRIFVVEGETSIECISTQLTKLVKSQFSPTSKVKVQCYEGIHKGAICEL